MGVVITLVACGGGSGESDSASPENTPPENEEDVQRTAAIPGLDEPNIRVPDLIVDNNGVQHAVAADISGAVFYAQCDQDCALDSSWESVAITTFDIDNLLSTKSVIPKLQLTSNNQPRVVLFMTNSVLESDSSWYFECNAVDCLDASEWRGQEAFAAIAVTEHDFYRARAFTLTADDQPRVTWLSTPEPLSFEDDALFYASCESDCATTLVPGSEAWLVVLIFLQEQWLI